MIIELTKSSYTLEYLIDFPNGFREKILLRDRKQSLTTNLGVVILKKALEVSMYRDVTRGEEYNAVAKAFQEGFNVVLEHDYSDEEVVLVQGGVVLQDLDFTDYETLTQSLKEQGYELVDIFEHQAS